MPALRPPLTVISVISTHCGTERAPTKPHTISDGNDGPVHIDLRVSHYHGERTYMPPNFTREIYLDCELKAEDPLLATDAPSRHVVFFVEIASGFRDRLVFPAGTQTMF